MTDSIRREMTFPQPREQVWRTLTDNATLARWLLPNDFVANVGHQFTFRTQPNPRAGFDGIIRCEVLKCQPPSELVYSWAGGAVDTRVSFRLEANGAGTRVFFEQSGFEDQQALKGAEYGWARMLEQLARLITQPA